MFSTGPWSWPRIHKIASRRRPGRATTTVALAVGQLGFCNMLIPRNTCGSSYAHRSADKSQALPWITFMCMHAGMRSLRTKLASGRLNDLALHQVLAQWLGSSREAWRKAPYPQSTQRAQYTYIYRGIQHT